MRADRLLALLMLLQSRGPMTARQLARALEVSERTIYRDVDALTTAGVPIYAEYRQGGGYALLDSYRTNLTGLTGDEVRALFMLSIPSPLRDLGMSEKLRTALLKLVVALPPGHRDDEERVRQRIYLDSTWWFQGQEAVPYLQTIQQAIWEDRRLSLKYRMDIAGIEIEQIVDPYGLVAKAGVWYLIYARNGALRANRIAHLYDVQVLDDSFTRLPGFDLATFWKAWCTEFELRRPSYLVTLRVAPHFARELPRRFDQRVRAEIVQVGQPDGEGWVTLRLPFESLEAARQRILSLGRSVEVLEPEPLRLSVQDFAAQIVSLYSARPCATLENS